MSSPPATAHPARAAHRYEEERAENDNAHGLNASLAAEVEAATNRAAKLSAELKAVQALSLETLGGRGGGGESEGGGEDESEDEGKGGGKGGGGESGGGSDECASPDGLAAVEAALAASAGRERRVAYRWRAALAASRKGYEAQVGCGTVPRGKGRQVVNACAGARTQRAVETHMRAHSKGASHSSVSTDGVHLDARVPRHARACVRVVR